MSPSAFVTGATGFVGSHLVRHLLDTGWDVCAAVRTAPPIGRLPRDHPQLRVHTLDGTTAGFRDALLEADADLVFHLAARFVYEHDADDIDDLVATNIGLGAHLLQGMVEAEVHRLVVASTMWCSHGELDDQPVNLYAATKSAFDPIVGYYSAAHDVSAVVLELGDNYGPHDHRGKVVSALVDAANEGTTLRMSPGDQLLDLTHIDDVVAALVVAAERLDLSSRPRLEQFNVLSGETISLRGLAAQIERLVGRGLDVEWGARNYRPREVMQPNAAPPGLPGWTPSVDLRDGLQSLIAEVQIHG